LIEEGQAIVRQSLRRNQPGAYQLQAAINAVHADVTTLEQTDWSQIVALYDRLLQEGVDGSSPRLWSFQVATLRVGLVRSLRLDSWATPALVDELDADLIVTGARGLTGSSPSSAASPTTASSTLPGPSASCPRIR
jgi:RNA polymerase sigma-70 factor (ECF subfamily)